MSKIELNKEVKSEDTNNNNEAVVSNETVVTNEEQKVSLDKANNETPENENYTPDKVNIGGKEIDMQEVHDKEQEISNTVTNELNNAADQLSSVLDKVNNGINGFIDKLDKPVGQANNGVNNQSNANFNAGAMGATNPNPNMNNSNPNMNMNNSNPNMNNTYNNDVVTPDKMKLEPTMAAIVSVLLTGLGQMINGQLEKGLTILIGGMVAVFVITLVTCGIGVITAPLLIVVSALDAYNCAKILQSGGTLGKWEFHIFN